jgi:hypothetical protein
MPRNEAKPLSRIDALRAYRFREALEAVDGPVTVQYEKRDGSSSSSRGTVSFFSGREGCDTMSVTLDTPDKGARTINLCRIKRVLL